MIARTGTGRRSAAWMGMDLLAAVTAAATLAGCAGAVGGNAGETAIQVGITQIAPAARAAAPLISGTALDGTPLALDKYAGDVTVLNVWGSWCSDCRLEAPALEEAYQKYRAKGVRFLGINNHDNNAAALAYARSFGITYPSFQDPDEALLLKFKSTLPATGIPSTVIIDRRGRVAVRILGAVTEPQLIRELEYVLGGG